MISALTFKSVLQINVFNNNLQAMLNK